MPTYSRTGDSGETSLADGTRIPKTDPLIEACGSLDEAAAMVGRALAEATSAEVRSLLLWSQQRLLNCCSRVATPPSARSAETPGVSDADVAFLERCVDAFEARAGTPAGLLVPGGSPAAAALHVARTVVRRAERRLLALENPDGGDAACARFLNRLSDCLFAAARYACLSDGVGEEVWDPAAPQPSLRLGE